MGVINNYRTSILSSQNLHRLDCELSKSSEQKKKEKIKEKESLRKKIQEISLRKKIQEISLRKMIQEFSYAALENIPLKNHNFSEKFRAPPF